MAEYNGTVNITANIGGISSNNTSSFVSRESFNGDKNKLFPYSVMNSFSLNSLANSSLGRINYNSIITGYLLSGNSLYSNSNILIVKELVKVSIKGRTSPMNFAINMSLNDRKSFN